MRKIHLTLLFLFLTSFIYAQEPFITTWNVQGSNLMIHLPVILDEGDSYNVDLGDGTVFSGLISSDLYHVYDLPGTYTVTLSGNFNRLDFSTVNMPYKNKLVSIEQWGDIQWSTMENAFNGCVNMEINATDTPNLTQVDNMAYMFYQCISLNQSIDNWDVSNVTNMNNMFNGCDLFNQPLNSWDVSNVTDMSSMFANTDFFDQPLNNWDVGNVTNMSKMFFQTGPFNQPLDSWDVSSVTNMSQMFWSANLFNQPIDSWDVSNVTDMFGMFYSTVFNQSLNNWDVSSVINMEHMFYNAVSFNGEIDNWVPSSVTSMSYMFYYCDAFNGQIGNWDVSSVTDMSSMFGSTDTFNQPLGDWDVSSVTDMSDMFFFCISFNQPLESWDVSNVENMTGMFSEASSFNQPLDNWDVSSVTKMSYMFSEPFNQPLNSWDVSNVTDMYRMFSGNGDFNQPLDNWDVSNVTNMWGIFMDATSFNQDLSSWNFNENINYYSFDNCGFDSNNYDALLLRFLQLGIEDVVLDSENLEYCNTGVRNYLINDLGWTINDDQLAESCLGNTITGTILFDENENGCDDNDIAATNFLISADNGEYSFATTSNNIGEYVLSTQEDNYTISVLNFPDYYIVTPFEPEIAFEGYGNTQELNFCITANEPVEDLNITILPVTDARPGFEAEYQLVIENIGTQTVANATVSFTYNDAMQSFVTALPAVSSNSENVLTFTLADFQPFESRTIDITMQTFTPPTVNGDDVLNFTATVTPSQNDYTPEDNTFDFEQVVVNSFDPNDKRVVQGSEIYPEQTDEYLDYIIRFQNTGTASAINIRVKDVLSDEVDWNTFRPVSSSHEYRLEITDGNQVEFIFENINLPFEGEDEAGSNGFIAYKIKPVEGLEVGDIIHGNEVNIYFDYNLPIITNSVTTEIVSLMGVNDYALNSSIVLYPNPANDVLHLKSENNLAPEMVAIYNLQGRELMSFNQNMENMNISGLSAGVYLINVKTTQGSAQYKLIKE